MRLRLALVGLAVLLACGQSASNRDGGPVDAGPPDAGGAPDSGAPIDAGPADAGPNDAGVPDAGLDAGPSDTGADAGPVDAGPTAVVTGPLIATVSVDPTTRGHTIPSDFVGLSIEVSTCIADPTDPFFGHPLSDGGVGPPNPVVVQLLQNLPRGTFRIGGNTVDQYCFDATTNERCEGYFGTADVAEVFQTAALVGWRVIFGVNLGINDPQLAVDEVEQAILPLSPGPLLWAVEIGNEPDGFASHVVTVKLPDGGTFVYTERDAGYDVADIEADTRPYIQALHGNPQTSGVPLAGPAASYPPHYDLATYAPAVEVDGGGLALLTIHYYPLNTCPGSLPDGGGWGNIPNLLGTPSAANTQRILSTSALQALDAGLPLQLGEANSSACGGAPGTSNTLAAALWGLDYLGRVASLGYTGIDFHGPSGTSGYAPIAVFGTPTPAQAQPLYYALLAFGSDFSGRTLVATDVADGGANVTAYSVDDADAGVLRVLVIDKDLAAGGYADVSVTGVQNEGRVTTLTGPQIDGGTVSWGEQEVDNATGVIAAPTSYAVPFDPDAGCYHVPLANGSAAVLELPRQ